MAENLGFAFGVTLFAGLSMMLGCVGLLLPAQNVQKTLSMALGFAAGVMLTVCLADILPEARESFAKSVGESAGGLLAVGMLLLGMLLAVGVHRLLPHHDHHRLELEHHHHGNREELLHVGLMCMVAISIHNIPEGIATFMTAYEDPTMGVGLAVAIVLHNIPVGLSVAMPIYYATGKRGWGVLATLGSGLLGPIAAALAYWLLQPLLSPLVLAVIMGLIAGAMLVIVFQELLPASGAHEGNHAALFSTLAGIVVMSLAHGL